MHFIDTDTAYRYCYRYYLVQKDMMWKVVENFKLFYYCRILVTVLKYFSQEQWVIILFVFYSIYIKGIVHPKMKIVSSFTHSLVVLNLNLNDFLSSVEHKKLF